MLVATCPSCWIDPWLLPCGCALMPRTGRGLSACGPELLDGRAGVAVEEDEIISSCVFLDAAKFGVLRRQGCKGCRVLMP